MAIYTATSTPKQVSVANSHRVSCTLFNNGAVDVFVGKGNDLTAAGGGRSLPLKANGGSIVFGPPKTYTGDIWVISSGADDQIFVHEENDFETRAD